MDRRFWKSHLRGLSRIYGIVRTGRGCFGFELFSLVSKLLYLLPTLGQYLAFVLIGSPESLLALLVLRQLLERHGDELRFISRLGRGPVSFNHSRQSARRPLVFMVAAIREVTFNTPLSVAIVAMSPSLPSIKRIIAATAGAVGIVGEKTASAVTVCIVVTKVIMVISRA